jgi:tetratricopeptide (TPR) repeat protein
MLTADREGLAFRHELARVAVEESTAPDRSLSLHRAALRALSAPPGGAPDLARLAHHADAADDAEAVLRFAPAAAGRAAAVGAHREAAAQYGRALRYAAGLPTEARAELLTDAAGLPTEARAELLTDAAGLPTEARAELLTDAAGLPTEARAELLTDAAPEYMLVGRATEAVELRRRAIEIYRATGRGDRAGHSLWNLLWALWLIGRRREAETAAREAVAVLEQLEPGHDLAEANGALAFLAMMDNDRDATVRW